MMTDTVKRELTEILQQEHFGRNLIEMRSNYDELETKDLESSPQSNESSPLPKIVTNKISPESAPDISLVVRLSTEKVVKAVLKLPFDNPERLAFQLKKYAFELAVLWMQSRARVISQREASSNEIRQRNNHQAFQGGIEENIEMTSLLLCRNTSVISSPPKPGQEENKETLGPEPAETKPEKTKSYMKKELEPYDETTTDAWGIVNSIDPFFIESLATRIFEWSKEKGEKSKWCCQKLGFKSLIFISTGIAIALKFLVEFCSFTNYRWLDVLIKSIIEVCEFVINSLIWGQILQ